MPTENITGSAYPRSISRVCTLILKPRPKDAKARTSFVKCLQKTESDIWQILALVAVREYD